VKSIERRVENIEKKLNINEKPETVTIILYGGQLPPGLAETAVVRPALPEHIKAAIKALVKSINEKQ
jgi:hypothetical protein